MLSEDKEIEEEREEGVEGTDGESVLGSSPKWIPAVVFCVAIVGIFLCNDYQVMAVEMAGYL